MTGAPSPFLATLLVAAGGALGASARFWAGRWTLAAFGSGWPWGTLLVNVAGGFLMGAIVGWGAHRAGLGADLRLFLTTGVLGGFTTFSAFSLDMALMVERGQGAQAALYALASVLLALGALMAGLALMRTLA